MGNPSPFMASISVHQVLFSQTGSSLSQKCRNPMDDPSVLYLCVAAGCVALFCAFLIAETLAGRQA